VGATHSGTPARAAPILARDDDGGIEIEPATGGLARPPPRWQRLTVRQAATAADPAPRRGPSTRRPWTDAAARPARTGASSTQGSAAAVSASATRTRRRTNWRAIRRAIVASRASISSPAGARTGWKTRPPLPANTPSSTSTCACTLTFSAAPKRWMTATTPLRPSATPCSLRAHRRSQPNTALVNIPITARQSA
jgi:hypothetical protein